MEKIVFDFDGTLVDSMPAWAGSMTNVLEKNGIEFSDEIIKIITPLGYLGTAKYFIEEMGVKMTVEEIIAMVEEYAYREYSQNIPAKETVPETLKTLKEMGYSLNVLTASPHVTLDVCLKRVGIYDLFDNVWSCDDFNTTKADVDIYRRTAEKLGTTVENCIFLDDNINAVTTAKGAGMRVIGVYDKSSDDMQAEMKALCGEYIYKFDELPGILRTPDNGVG